MKKASSPGKNPFCRKTNVFQTEQYWRNIKNEPINFISNFAFPVVSKFRDNIVKELIENNPVKIKDNDGNLIPTKNIGIKHLKDFYVQINENYV